MTRPQELSDNNSNSHLPSVLIIGGLFFMFGFVTWLNGSLIPFLQITCQLDHMQAYYVTLVFYIAYTIMALPSAHVLKKVGYKKGMVAGLLIMTLGALVFIPASQSGLYSLFLIALFIMGTGLTVLQTASNPYIVVLGPKETAAVRISLMGVLNKSAGVVAPIVFTTLVFSDMSLFTKEYLASLSEVERASALSELSERLTQPYLIMAGMLAILSLLIWFSPLPEVGLNDTQKQQNNKLKSNKSILAYPQVVLGMVTLFLYIGAEVIAGDTIGVYGKELGLNNFAQLTSYTMAFMVIAYLFGIMLIPRVISQENALLISAALGIFFVILIALSSAESTGVWDLLFNWTGATAVPNTILFVALLGFANALVWPSVWPMALNGLGNKTAEASALLIMGISGGAILPIVYGAIVEATENSQLAYLIMLPCYMFVLYYALKGHRKSAW